MYNITNDRPKDDSSTGAGPPHSALDSYRSPGHLQPDRIFITRTKVFLISPPGYPGHAGSFLRFSAQRHCLFKRTFTGHPGTIDWLPRFPGQDILVGYLLGFLLFAMVQTLILFFYAVYVLKADFLGDLWQIIVFQILIGILAVCLGIFISAFARNEFQMIQFIPLIIVPQIFVCGVLFPVSQQPEFLQWLAKFLPLTYAVDGIRALMLQGKGLLDIGKEIGVLAAYSIVLMILAGFSLRGSKAA